MDFLKFLATLAATRILFDHVELDSSIFKIFSVHAWLVEQETEMEGVVHVVGEAKAVSGQELEVCAFAVEIGGFGAFLDGFTGAVDNWEIYVFVKIG